MRPWNTVNDDPLAPSLAFAVSVKIIKDMSDYLHKIDAAWLKAADAAHIDTLTRTRKKRD